MSKKRKREDEQVILSTVSAYTISCNFFKHFRVCTCVFSLCSLFIIVYLHQQFLDVATYVMLKHYNPVKVERFQGPGVHHNQQGILQVSLSISL